MSNIQFEKIHFHLCYECFGLKSVPVTLTEPHGDEMLFWRTLYYCRNMHSFEAKTGYRS